MAFSLTIEQVQAQLQKLRETSGEVVYEQTRKKLALSLLQKPNGEEYVRKAFPDMDVEALKAAAESDKASPQASPEEVMLRLLQQHMPSIKTQGHYNLFAASFDALRTTLDGYFSGNFEQALKARDALNKVLDTAAQVKSIVEKLDEIPPNDRSAVANEYMEPPKQFHEFDTQRQLMIELDSITTLSELGGWYARTKEMRDQVTSQKLRNELIDKIRAKRNELDAKEKGSN